MNPSKCQKQKEVILTKPVLYEMFKVLEKKKKIKTTNNEMAINIYLPTIESKKQTKQTRTIIK